MDCNIGLTQKQRQKPLMGMGSSRAPQTTVIIFLSCNIHALIEMKELRAENPSSFEELKSEQVTG